jgi:hypothetical protein
MWTSASLSGGRCFFITLDHRRTAPPQGTFVNRPCTRVEPLQPNVGHRVAYTINGPDAIGGVPPCGLCGYAAPGVPAVIYGELRALSPAAKIIARSTSGSRALAIQGHWLLGNVPSLPSGMHWRLIAYSQNGRVIGRVYL